MRLPSYVIMWEVVETREERETEEREVEDPAYLRLLAALMIFSSSGLVFSPSCTSTAIPTPPLGDLREEDSELYSWPLYPSTCTCTGNY